MTDRAPAMRTAPVIPTAAQIRAMPATSPKALVNALAGAGLTVTHGGRHWRVTAGDIFLGSIPLTPSNPRSMRNCRSWLARRVEELAAGGTR